MFVAQHVNDMIGVGHSNWLIHSTEPASSSSAARFCPGGIELAYASIPDIRTLPQPLKNQVRAAFAESLVLLWKIITAVLACGLLSSLFMADVPMHNYVDEKWALETGAARETELVVAA
jgi:hypothetical protein